jgi:hypothetical protein
MTLDGLRTVLQSQADAHQAIVVSQATVQAAQLTPRTGFDTLVQSRLLLHDDLTLTFSGTVGPPTATTLSLSGGAPSLLGASGVNVDVVFTEQGDQTVDVQLAVELPDSWTLGAAFTALQGEPFSELTLSSTRYVVTTAPADSFGWQSQKYPIAQGASLFSMLTLNGPLAVVVALLEGATQDDTTPLIGTVDPSQMKDPGWFPLLGLTAVVGHELGVPHFELSAPRIELHTVPDDGSGRPYCWLNFATTLSVNGEPLCNFKAAVSAGLSTVTFGMYPLDDPKAVVTLPVIMELLGADFTVPPDLTEVFNAVGLKGLSATVAVAGPSIVSASAAIGSTKPPWSYGQLEIEDTTLRVTALDPVNSGPVMLSFDAQACLFPNSALDVLFDLALTYSLDSGELTIAAGIEHPVPIADALNAISGGGIEPPEGWSLTLSEFGVTFDKPVGGTAQYQLFATADAGFQLPMLGAHVDSDLQLVVDSAQKSFKLVGGLTVGDSRFTAEVDLTDSSKVVSGSWTALHGDYLELSPLLRDLGLTQVDIPKGLDLNLESAQITYDITNSILTIEADSATYGKAVFAALKSPGWVFFFGLDVNHRLALSDVPLIGKELAGVVSVAVDDITVLVSSELDATAAGAVNKAIANLGPWRVPTNGMKDVALSMSFDAGGEKTQLLIAAPPDSKQTQSEHAGALAVLGDPAAPPGASDGTIWINLQKTFGPVSFQKVGIRYRSSVLYFLMNASVGGGGLSVAVIGLGVGSPLSSFQLKFTIDGIAITFAEGPVELSGALVGSLEPDVNFYGELILGVEALQISAIGGYAEVEHHPSLFLYAVLDYPIGGPEFFFVTGLAAGFGYNRKLLIPPVDGVATFPLVQWAQGTGNPPSTDPTSLADEVEKVVSQLSASGIVAPSVGDDWVALGVKFTSFDLVNSFALLTIVFGTRFEIALLGMSTVQLPPAPAPAVAQAQLELEATFTPETGLLAISGQLTPESFVLSRACHLTGGFAFWSWFREPHEGEFVVTLGGYSPRFTKPGYYPTVPRLGLNWRVTPELTIAGDLYFALTSSAVMAGGGMSAVWQSGDIRAWFDVEADFLLVFQPFHYYLSAGIHLGASFTLDLAFTKITVSIHLGVEVEIWGPEFAGKATVDLSIVSFTIGFGAGNKHTDTTIGWSDFLKKLMPSGGPQQEQEQRIEPAASVHEFGVADPPPPPDPAVVQITPSDGLLKRLSDKEGELNWVVSGQKLKLVTQSAIPTKDWTFLSDNIRLAEGAPTPTTDFGVGPTGTAAATFTSTHTIEIDAEEPGSLFVATPLQRNVSTALWQPRKFDSNGVPENLDPLNDTTIPGVAVGFTLEPFVPDPDHTLPIPRQNIQYTIVQPIVELDWSDATVPLTDDFPAQHVWATIGTQAVSTIRSALSTAAAGAGFAVPTDIDVSELATADAYDLIADPVLRLLGEQR